MGQHLISTLVITLLALMGIDAFVHWYGGFLRKRGLPSYLQRAIRQLLWVLLALVLWNALYHNFLPAEFDGSHLLFALFAFSLRGLVLSVFARES